MKQKLILFTILMIVLATPKVAVAYDFSAVAPSGQTLYYNIVGGNAEVTHPSTSTGYGNYDGYTIPTGNLTIPSSVTYGENTYSVNSIGSYAFSHCSGLVSVTIPNSVTAIGYMAFSDCTGLTSVTIPNSVTNIEGFSFYWCTALTTVNFNATNCIYSSGSTIALGAFFGCSNISTVNIGNNVTTIPSYLFSHCGRFTTMTIPNSVTYIGKQAFYCTGLTSVSIPNSVTYIGEGAFSRCTRLTSIIINSPASSIGKGAFEECGNLATVILSVDTIQESAFKNCDHLTNITFGSDLTAIENDAFDGCTQVVRIVSKAMNPPVVQSSTFSSLSDDVILNVPCDAANAYENAAYWFRFNIQEDLVFDFSAMSSNPARGTVTIVTEPTCDYREAQIQANAYHGYHFDHWSDGNTDNPRYIVVLQDTHLVAYFASDNGEDEGIEETAEKGVKLYQRNGQIVVEGAEGNRVMVYDIYGRVLAVKRDDGGLLRFDAPAAGVYLVRVGDAPARKVAVVR